LHLAVSLADRYLAALSLYNFTPKVNLVAIGTISILLAAKLEQPISPSFSRMITLLPHNSNITRDDLVALEKHILETLDFNLQWAGPIPFIERFAKLFSVEASTQVNTLFQHFCGISALQSSICLEFKPS